MNTYLLVFNPLDGGRSEMTDFLETLDVVRDWHASLNHAVVVVSAADATALTERVRDRFPDVRFVITPLDLPLINGVLPRGTWDFITATNARPSREDPARSGQQVSSVAEHSIV